MLNVNKVKIAAALLLLVATGALKLGAQPSPEAAGRSPCRIGLAEVTSDLGRAVRVNVTNADCPVGTRVEVTATALVQHRGMGIRLSWASQSFEPPPNGFDSHVLTAHTESVSLTTRVALSITRCNGGPCTATSFDVYPRRMVSHELQAIVDERDQE